ncbi:MAG: signal peptide peptidase SppA [Alphaproteobacteria bacterium]|nr:signal peptide peptidase SppA [Alphaproteobacteria bacterium]
MFVEPRDREEEGFLKSLFRFIKHFFIIVGMGTTVMFVMLGVALNKVAHYTPPMLPDNMVLTYTFKSGLLEKVANPSLSQPLFVPATTFHEVIDDLAAAAKDKRVKGFVARLQDIDMTPAQLQELRDALAAFRASGKFASVFAEELGGEGSGIGDYYLAAAFGQIWLQPVGSVSVNGISIEVPFLKDVMEKAGVEAQFVHKGIYKSAPESLTETGMSAPHREMMTGLVNDLSGQIIDGIAADRKMTAEVVRGIINGAPYSDSEALQLKLVDKTGYYDQMLDEAKAKAGKDAKTVRLLDYSLVADEMQPDKGMAALAGKMLHKGGASGRQPKIALIIGDGEIVSYKGNPHGGFGGPGMSADKIVEAFDDAEEDKDVAAVVFRIDSPGGSPAAAESIRRAIMRVQQKGLPVIVSMGGYAASGGYWIATPADKIVAEPASITGSIGVFGGKIVLAQLWKKLGVNWEGVSVGDHARMWSANTAFSPQERARFDSMLDSVYEAFIARVMEGRKMTRAQVLAVAEGRVWTGRQAKEKGLVDELGGLDKAVALAKAAAKLPPGEEIPVERFPAPKSPLEMFVELATEGVSVMPVININAGDVLRGMNAEMEILKAPALQLR